MDTIERMDKRAERGKQSERKTKKRRVKESTRSMMNAIKSTGCCRRSNRIDCFTGEGHTHTRAEGKATGVKGWF